MTRPKTAANKFSAIRAEAHGLENLCVLSFGSQKFLSSVFHKQQVSPGKKANQTNYFQTF